MKIRSKDKLLDIIDEEYTWRFHEIANIKTEVKSMNPSNKKLAPMVRSLVMLSYSHWEGFVKYSTRYFFDYLSFLALDLSQTNPALVASSLSYDIANRGKVDSIQLIQKVLTDKSFKPVYHGEIMTDPNSNLNFKILEIIATNIGISISSLTIKKTKLDEIILGRRNKMAHGENDSIDKNYGVEVADASLELMNDFKTLLQNMIATEGYRV